jgi:hypothetical protein
MKDMATVENNEHGKNAFYTINVSDFLGSTEYNAVIDDLLRMLCIQLTIQIMLYFGGSSGTDTFWTNDFVLLLIYIELGVLLYWLVVKKLVKVT